MLNLTDGKRKALIRLSNDNNIISAIAIDQRGSIKKMMNKENPEKVSYEEISGFKEIVSENLTKYSSAILLDTEYGLKAAKLRSEESGLLLAYEESGYNPKEEGRIPKLEKNLSVKRLKEYGADAIKILIYYNIDDEDYINDEKKAFVERVGNECRGENIPFFMEIITYDNNIKDSKSREFAKLKPRKVIESVKIFNDKRYGIDVLKLEVPVNMEFVEGFTEDYVYTREEALSYFKEESDSTNLPFIFLSGGVSAELFQDTLKFAKRAGSTFNGVLCGRATWADGVGEYSKSYNDGKNWLLNQGRKNMEDLNKVLNETASPWSNKVF